MPLVTNCASSPRGLCATTNDADGNPQGINIERVAIPVGKTIEVEERFLATEGAKFLIERGDLEVGSEKQRKAAQAKVDKAEAAEAKQKADAEQAQADALATALGELAALSEDEQAELVALSDDERVALVLESSQGGQ